MEADVTSRYVHYATKADLLGRTARVQAQGHHSTSLCMLTAPAQLQQERAGRVTGTDACPQPCRPEQSCHQGGPAKAAADREVGREGVVGALGCLHERAGHLLHQLLCVWQSKALLHLCRRLHMPQLVSIGQACRHRVPQEMPLPKHRLMQRRQAAPCRCAMAWTCQWQTAQSAM